MGKIIKLLFLLAIFGLLGCGKTISSDIKLIDNSATQSMPIPPGKYIDKSTNDGIHKIYSLGGNVFQYKGPEVNIAETMKLLSKNLSEATTTKDKLEISQLMEQLKDNEYMKDHLYNDVTFETMDMGNGWFVVQITNIVQIKFLEEDSINKYDFLVGFIKDGNIQLYDTTVCATNVLADKYGIVFDKNSEGETLRRLKSIKQNFTFHSFVIGCINEKIYPSSSKLKFQDLIRVN